MKRPVVLLCNLYRPPSSSHCINDVIFDMLETALSHGKTVIVREGSDSPFHDRIVTELNLTQLITQPTRTTASSESLIDHLYTTDASKFSRTGCALVALSDHHMIYGVRVGQWKEGGTEGQACQVLLKMRS